MSFSSASLPLLPLPYAFSCAAETNNPSLTSDFVCHAPERGLIPKRRGRGLIYMTLIETLERREEALNVRQVAELLGVSAKHIYELAAQGKLPAFRVGKAVRFDPQDVADWLRKRKPSNERQETTKSQKPKSSKPNQSGEKQSTSPAHIWRNRISSLEVALSDSSANGTCIKNSEPKH